MGQSEGINHEPDLLQDGNGVSLRLSAQRALWGAVTSNLRAASVEYRPGTVACRFIFAGEPSDRERELVSAASAEIVADCSEPIPVDGELVVVPCPAEMEHLAHLVYLRFEPDPTSRPVS